MDKEKRAVAEFARGILAYVEDGNVIELHECGFVEELRQAIRDGGLEVAAFVEEVVRGEGEGDGGTVYVDGFSPEGTDPFFVGVCSCSVSPDYVSIIPATAENIRAVVQELGAAGLSVITDLKEWYAQLKKWELLGKGN